MCSEILINNNIMYMIIGIDQHIIYMMADIDQFQSTPVGTDQFNELGARLVENMVSNLLFIGVVQAPAPVYHRNILKNFTTFKTHSYEYYRTYPYRGPQWYLDE